MNDKVNKIVLQWIIIDSDKKTESWTLENDLDM